MNRKVVDDGKDKNKLTGHRFRSEFHGQHRPRNPESKIIVTNQPRLNRA